MCLRCYLGNTGSLTADLNDQEKKQKRLKSVCPLTIQVVSEEAPHF